MQIQDPDRYKGLKQEVLGIKERLNSINKDKEIWFNRKEDLKKDINFHVQKIKEIKSARDKKNIEVEELKKQRDKYNTEVKHLIKKIKKLNQEKAEAFKKYNLKVEPSKIQQKINELEKRVELEVNFEKEKKLMEEIKKLKKAYEESTELRGISDKTEVINNEIKISRKKADEFHKKILEITKDVSYQGFIDLSKKINELKSKQEAAFQKFIDHKNKYAEINKELRSLAGVQVLGKTIIGKKQIKQQENTESYLKKKLRQVQEKIKSKKKLTTEDILAIQGAGNL